MVQGDDPEEWDQLGVLSRCLPLQFVELVESVALIVRKDVTHEDVVRDLDLVERTQTDVGQVRHIALQSLLS